MPEFRSLDVRVVDKDGNELQEWGVQHLCGQNKISSYIKSSTNMAFRVTVQPRLPFQSPDLPIASDFSSAISLSKSNGHNSQGKLVAGTLQSKIKTELEQHGFSETLTQRHCRNGRFQIWSSKRIHQTSKFRLASN